MGIAEQVDAGLPISADVRTPEWTRLRAENGHDFGTKFTVLVDGIEPESVYAWDVREGWADHMPNGPDGRRQLTPDGKDVLRARIHGRVEVRWKKDVAA